MNPVEVFTLSSGLTCAFLYNSSPVAYAALSSLAGTRFEPKELPGLAHLGEHMLFKGTQKRRAWHINCRLERLGGELNAFTTKEEMVVQATTLKEDISPALDLIADLVFHSIVPDKELLKEKEVVADEIRTYKDIPNELIYDDFESLIFQGSPLATPILGTTRSLARITRENLLDFYASRFAPKNMVLSIVGKYTTNRVRYLAEKYFGSEEGIEGAKDSAKNREVGIAPYKAFGVEHKKNTHQIHCIIGAPAYNLHQEERSAMSLLMNMLAGPASNALLNLSLREKYGLVYTVESSFSPYSDAGWAGIYFGTDKPKLEQCLNLTDKTLDKLINNKLSEISLERAKKQFLGQIAIASDNPESQCLSLGKNLLTYGRIISHSEIVDQIKRIKPEDVLKAASLLSPSLRSSLIYS